MCEVGFQRARQLQRSFSSLLVEVVWSRIFKSLFRAHDDDLASARTFEKRHGTATGSVTQFPAYAAVPGSSAICRAPLDLTRFSSQSSLPSRADCYPLSVAMA
jgi:hypothetical protein